MSARLFALLVLVLGVGTITVGCIINHAAVIVVGGLVLGQGLYKGASL